jgi:pimeloyl-ACP methyl ester carboxylesterase
MKTILFLHGSAGSKNNFKYLRKEFSDLEAIAFNLTGFGDEDKPKEKYDVDFFLKDIKKKLRGKKPDYVTGHSLGAILAKEYALKNNVEKIFLINYPINKDAVLDYKFNKMFSEGHLLAKIACWTKVAWKYLLFPFAYVFYNKYFDSFKNYFKHSNHSETSSLNNVILKDDFDRLDEIKGSVIFISGERDKFVDFSKIKNYKNYTIKGMKHNFFGHEKEIAKIIKMNL